MFRTLTGRLTAAYGGLFFVLALVLYGFFYWSLSGRLLQRVDDELVEDAGEIVEFLQDSEKGEGALQAFLDEEIGGEDAGKEFIRVVVAGDGGIVATDLSAWEGLGGVLAARGRGAAGEPVLTTLELPGREDAVRTLSLGMDDGTVIQMGVTREDDEELLASVQGIFGGVTAVMILIGGVLGWFMAKRALGGLERVTDTALEIEKGDLERRVTVGNEGAEIERLAEAFNGMLDQIRLLVSELKEVTQNIAHDLRSPVTRIRGICETTLRGDADGDEYREMAATVIEEADRLVNMINIMLEIAETDSGVARVARIPVDVNELVRDVVELHEPLAEDRGIHVTVEQLEDDAVVPGDAPRLQRVLANLLDNAIKYTPADGSIHLSTQSAEDIVLVSVRDTGIGMDGDTLAHAFDRFYRGDQSRTTPGNGLGLSLARAFIRAHGGDINVRSTPDSGTEFRVILPRTAY